MTILYVCFRSTLVVFIFCLMNLMMINQTAQWRIFEFEVGERCLASENERLTVFVCYHYAVRGFELLF